MAGGMNPSRSLARVCTGSASLCCSCKVLKAQETYAQAMAKLAEWKKIVFWSLAHAAIRLEAWGTGWLHPRLVRKRWNLHVSWACHDTLPDAVGHTEQLAYPGAKLHPNPFWLCAQLFRIHPA